MKWYLKNLLIAFDQLLNAFLNGHADETLSSRSYRARLAGRPFPANLIDWAAAILGDNDHCKEAYISERTGRQLPPELRSRCRPGR